MISWGFSTNFFGGGRKKEKEVTAAMHRLFEHALQLLNDDVKQNFLMPEKLQQVIARGRACDTIEGASGPFGRTPENPIPVNGPLGEITYLSKLVTTGSGQRVGFHRLGSMNSIDVYEVVSLDGTFWDVLFFDCYHDGKSKKTPEGYHFARRVEALTGSNCFNPDFPSHLRDHAVQCSSKVLGIPLPHPDLRNFENQQFRRPDKHAKLFYATLDLICARNRPT